MFYIDCLKYEEMVQSFDRLAHTLNVWDDKLWLKPFILDDAVSHIIVDTVFKVYMLNE